jgi:hypothetical protein
MKVLVLLLRVIHLNKPRQMIISSLRTAGNTLEYIRTDDYLILEDSR